MIYKSIDITEKVCNYICNQADLGYDSPYKQERIGFLFGIIRKNIRITHAVSYKGGIRKRTRVDLSPDSFLKRGNTIAAKLRKQLLGTYHTHVEENDEISFGLSIDDKVTFMNEPYLIELVITIWATDNSKRLIPGRKRLLAIKRFGDTNYRYIISGYVKTSKGPKLTEIKRM